VRAVGAGRGGYPDEVDQHVDLVVGRLAAEDRGDEAVEFEWLLRG
jgi:hypothetical protein